MNPPKPLPVRLKHDAIIEALFEIRFDVVGVPDLFLGQLADHRGWSGFEQRALPASSIPAPIRQADPNLRYGPLFELVKNNGAIRLGPRVLSYHRKPPYDGWATFRPDAREAVEALFSKARSGLVVRRLGLRYLNALTPSLHLIRLISDLNVKLTIADGSLTERVNLNFARTLDESTQCTVRLATPDFVQGELPKETSIVIDVDVFTNEKFSTRNKNEVIAWIDSAHDQEKQQFFGLLTPETIEQLREK